MVKEIIPDDRKDDIAYLEAMLQEVAKCLANKVYEDALYLYSININPEFIEELLSKKDKLRGYNTIIPQVIAKELDINLDRTREETFEILELLYGL